MDSPSMPLGVFGILREAFKTPSRNGKLFLLIAISFFIPVYLLSLVVDLAVQPFAKDILMKASLMGNMNVPNNPDYEKQSMEIFKDGAIIFLESVVFLLVSSLISLLARTATILTSAAVYKGKHLTDMGLAVKIRNMWKRPVITWFYILLFNFLFLVLISGLYGVVVLTAKASLPLAAVALVLEIAVVLYYFYLTVVWDLSVVVSVLEPENYGIRGVEKASKLINGRKIKGCILYVLITAVGLVMGLLIGFGGKYLPQGQATKLGIGLISEIVSCISAMFMGVALTLFYADCKKNHGEKVEIEGESGYSLVPSATDNV
ncbi:hypothetical protein ACLOJK_002777 [Asimina triloba]